MTGELRGGAQGVHLTVASTMTMSPFPLLSTRVPVHYWSRTKMRLSNGPRCDPTRIQEYVAASGTKLKMAHRLALAVVLMVLALPAGAARSTGPALSPRLNNLTPSHTQSL